MNFSILAKLGQQIVAFSPPELQSSHCRQRPLSLPLHTDPLISMATHRLKLPSSLQVGLRVGTAVVGTGMGFLVGWFVGCSVGLNVGLLVGCSVG